MSAPSPEREVCRGCGEEIDPDVCWCGDEMGKHTGYEGHSPVPLGCECGYDKRETSEND